MQRDAEFQELMEVAQQQGKVHEEMQVLEKEVEKRDSDIQQLQKQLKEAEHILVGGASLSRYGRRAASRGPPEPRKTRSERARPLATQWCYTWNMRTKLGGENKPLF